MLEPTPPTPRAAAGVHGQRPEGDPVDPAQAGTRQERTQPSHYAQERSQRKEQERRPAGLQLLLLASAQAGTSSRAASGHTTPTWEGTAPVWVQLQD